MYDYFTRHMIIKNFQLERKMIKKIQKVIIGKNRCFSIYLFYIFRTIYKSQVFNFNIP